MSQADTSIHVVTTHAAIARAASKAEPSAAGASEGVDFSALLASQLGTSAEGLKASDNSAVPQEEKAKPDLADDDATDPSAQADALAALGIPAIHPNAQAAAVDAASVRRVKFDGEKTDANADTAETTPAAVVALADAKRSLPAELAAASEVGDMGGAKALPAANGSDSATTPIASPGVAPVQAPATPPAQGVNPAEQPIALARANFADEVGNRLTWMATHGKQEAEIRIDPPHLGPLELRLSITGDQASLSVVSAHAAVRDAVQNSVSRLQDMMQAVGVNLGQVFVGQGSQDQQSRGEFANRSNRPTGSRDDDEDGAMPVLAQMATAVRSGSGLVDVFA